jgi:hypothetical protein
MKYSILRFYHILFIIVILITSLSNPLPAGDIQWDRLHFGVDFQLIIPYGDFGRYWNEAFGLGIIARYELESRIFLRTSGSIGYFSRSEYADISIIPHIYIINLSGGLSIHLPATNSFYAIFGTGVDNFTFIFGGEATEKVSANYIESEIGVHAEGGFGIKSKSLQGIEISGRYGILFTLPELIHLLRVNLVFYF